MCIYEMDLASIVEETERTQFCPQTDGRTEGRCETSIPPSNFVEAGILKGWRQKNLTMSAAELKYDCKITLPSLPGQWVNNDASQNTYYIMYYMAIGMIGCLYF